MFDSILSSPWYAYVLLPLFIFVGRIIDVGMGTVRMIFTTRGLKHIAPVISFFEILIWLLVIKQIFSDITNPISYIAYAGGFATGTYIGIRIEEKLSVGKVMVRIITGRDSTSMIKKLKDEKYRFTVAPGKGSEGDVSIILSIVERKEAHEIINIIKEFNPDAFYTIEDLRFVHEHPAPNNKNKIFDIFKGIRKGK